MVTTAALTAAFFALPGPAAAPAAPVAPWPMFGHDPQHTGKTSVVGPTAANVAWTLTLSGQTNSNTGPVVGPDGSIYVTTRNNFYAVNPDGTIRCSTSVFAGTAAPALSQDGSAVYVPDGLGLHALKTSDCSTVWDFSASISGSSPTVDGNGIIYFGTGSGTGDSFLYALNPDGTPHWSWDSGSTCFIDSSPAIGHNGNVYFEHNCLYLIALDSTGHLLWDHSAMGGPFDQASVGSDDTVYIGNSDAALNFNALSPSDGHTLWSVPVGHFMYDASAAISGTSEFRGDNGLDFYRFQNGVSVWRTSLGTPGSVTNIPSSPALDGSGVVYVSANDFRALSAADGTTLWTYPTGGSEDSPAIGADGTVYAVGTDSSTAQNAVLYAFGCGADTDGDGVGDSCQPPATVLNSGPSGYVPSSSATFTFSSPQAGVSFVCSLDGSAPTACTSPATYQGLADGLHKFRVHATKPGVSIDPNGAGRQWNVDITPPGAKITPPASDSGPATFAFGEPVRGVTGSNVVIRVHGTTTDLAATLTCLNSAGKAVSCASGPVSKAVLQPTTALTSGGSYTLIVDPAGAAAVTDQGGNALHNIRLGFTAP